MDGVDLSMVGSEWALILNSIPSLTELHLSSCSLSGISQSLHSVNMTSLAVIDLSLNSLNSIIPAWFVNLTSLVRLDMNSGMLHGPIPLGFAELPNLRYLNLALNNNLSADCSKLISRSWRQIEIINLGSNSLFGNLPASIGNITSLVELDLSTNNIQGGIPSSIANLCNLGILDLSNNNLTLKLAESLETISNRCISEHPLASLRYLSLSNNQLTGKLPEWLGGLASLQVLGLSINSFQGPIPSSLGKLSFLTDLNLEGNALTGTLPPTLGQLSRVVNFDASSNQLTGTISEVHFLQLRDLKILLMSSNSLTINVSSDWVPPFQVRNLDMGSCKLGPQFPSWLKNQKELMYLDVSNASISDMIPSWFWDLSSNLSLLNISFNRIKGQLPSLLSLAAFADIDLSSNLLYGPIPLPSNEVELLDLSDNQISGPIPREMGTFLPNLIFLSLANNNLIGEIPASIGEMQSLQVLQLSRNNLTGDIPPSIGNFSYLKALALEYNNLSGGIPQSIGGLKQLQSLHLSNNRLYGMIPVSLQNCSSLETLDLGYNRLWGNIPTWIAESLPALRILRLRLNKFSGRIPTGLSNISSLQVIDLAENNLEGPIPRSFGNIKYMTTKLKVDRYLLYGQYRGRYYEESLTVNIKNQQLEYTKTLPLVTSIDLSGNNLSGEFPEELTSLSGLLVLDLSRNNLNGSIPERIANMHELTSLGLASNHFSGSISSGLSTLSFLGFLDLSINNFSGRIPSGGQLDTFNPSAYSRNPYLCGAPLDVICRKHNSDGETINGGTTNSGSGPDAFEDKWFYLSVALGFTVGLLGPYAVISIKKPWSVAYFEMVDWIINNMVAVKSAVMPQAAKQRRLPRGTEQRHIRR